ncbi:ArsR family transcriptional regulator [Microbacterium sorbitolivorans]|nr:ArsR family transcriptional regulator [Microbacterium sorbitolivorans]
MNTPGDDVSRLGLLADPARRRLYDVVVAQQDPVTREAAAAAAGISGKLAAYHLDKLADAGLLDVDYAREPGRTGPGAGRPAKRYRRSAREVAASFPPRNYSLLAHILADAADDEGPGPVRHSLERAAERAGRSLGERAGDLPTALDAGGYVPADTDDGDVILRNCPFHSVAQEHTQLVCTLNHAVIRGALEGTGDDPDRAELDPCDGRCCIVIHPEARP